MIAANGELCQEIESMRGDLQDLFLHLRADIRREMRDITNEFRDDLSTLLKRLEHPGGGFGGTLSQRQAMRHRGSTLLDSQQAGNFCNTFSQQPSTLVGSIGFFSKQDSAGFFDSASSQQSIVPEMPQRPSTVLTKPILSNSLPFAMESTDSCKPKKKQSSSLLRRTVHHNIKNRVKLKDRVRVGLLARKPLQREGTTEGLLELESETVSDFRNLSYSRLSAHNNDDIVNEYVPGEILLPLAVEKTRLQKLVEGGELETGTCFLVVINAILIGIETEIQMRGGHSIVFSISDTVLGALFALELSLRVCVYQSRFFLEADWAWNLFDCVVVGQQIIETILRVFEFSGQKHMLMGYLRILRLARILRVTRILRMVRVVRFIGELRTIANSVTASMKSLVWTLLLMFMVIYIVAVFVCGLILEYRIENEKDADGIALLMAQYGSLPCAVLTLYECITGGLNWQTAVHPLIDQISPLLAVLFVFYIAFCVFCVMNVVTGVFCDKAAETAQREKDEEISNLLGKIFDPIAKDPNGKITFEDFAKQCNTEEMQHYFDALHIDIIESEFVFELIDVKGSGKIDPADFTNACLRLRGPAQAIELRMLMHETVAIHESITEMASNIVSLVSGRDVTSSGGRRSFNV